MSSRDPTGSDELYPEIAFDASVLSVGCSSASPRMGSVAKLIPGPPKTQAVAVPSVLMAETLVEVQELQQEKMEPSSKMAQALLAQSSAMTALVAQPRRRGQLAGQSFRPN